MLTNSEESDTAEVLHALLIEIIPMLNSEIVPESLNTQTPGLLQNESILTLVPSRTYLKVSCSDLICGMNYMCPAGK